MTGDEALRGIGDRLADAVLTWKSGHQVEAIAQEWKRAALATPSSAPDVEGLLIAAINDEADLRLPDGRLAIAREHAVEVIRAALRDSRS